MVRTSADQEHPSDEHERDKERYYYRRPVYEKYDPSEKYTMHNWKSKYTHRKYHGL